MSEQFPKPEDDIFSAATMFEAIYRGPREHKAATIAVATGAIAFAGGIAAITMAKRRKTSEVKETDSADIDDVSGNI